MCDRLGSARRPQVENPGWKRGLPDTRARRTAKGMRVAPVTGAHGKPAAKPAPSKKDGEDEDEEDEPEPIKA